MKSKDIVKKPGAILFDLDDTLVSFGGQSLKLWRQCCLEVIDTGGIPFELDEVLDILFLTKQRYWDDPIRHKKGREDLTAARREVVALTFDEMGFHDEKLAIQLADLYSTRHDASIRLFQGSLGTLEYFLACNVNMGLITNGSSVVQRGKLARFDLERFFDVILIDQEVGFSKPHPKIFSIALEELSSTAGEVWMLGDNLTWDIQGAQSVGIYSIWADYTNAGLPVDAAVIPDKTIHSIEEIKELYNHAT